MTATIVSASDSLTARRQATNPDGPDVANTASLPPVSRVLVDTLFKSATGQTTRECAA